VTAPNHTAVTIAVLIVIIIIIGIAAHAYITSSSPGVIDGQILR
jgi:hypothetical protein